MDPKTLRKGIEVKPVPGKTFSLLAGNQTSVHYYQIVKLLVDEWLQEDLSAENLLALLRKLRNPGRSIRGLRRWKQFRKKYEFHLQHLEKNLSPYLTDVEGHLRSLSLLQRFDRTLRTSRRQYFFYMIEIELINRINISRFKSAETKLAFLPHCLRDLSKACKAQPDDLDYQCRRCSKSCFIRHCSEMLEKFNIKPYIWMQVDLRRLLRHLNHEQQSTAVLGIACIPELINGMRLCARYQTPVIGIPLDANRCGRWMGEFFDNSVNLKVLEDLLQL